jgi:hypothetical protein
MLASRVFPDGDRKDVSRHTISVLAFSIPAGSRLDCRSCSLAPTGHCERSPVAAQVTWAADACLPVSYEARGVLPDSLAHCRHRK